MEVERSQGQAAHRGGAAELELPGFRFHPTEEELLEFYLKQVVHGKKLKFDIIPTVQLYRHDPWELPALARINGEREWYFFVPRDCRKQQSGGGRPSRTTERGFWKATGSDRAVRRAADPKRLIGLKKTLVYYEGRAPRGTKTDWVMNEYRLPDDDDNGSSSSLCLRNKDSMVLCKIYRKAVSLKELEQRVAMEELARATATATPSPASHTTGSPADSFSSSAEPLHQQQQVTTMAGVTKKEEAVVEAASAAAVARPATLSLPQLEVARPSQQQQQQTGLLSAEWTMQDPFLTQLRSPWMDGWSSPAFYASVLNF